MVEAGDVSHECDRMHEEIPIHAARRKSVDEKFFMI